MKFAYFILAHKNPEQFIRLLQQLDSADSVFFVHVDSKFDIAPFKKIEEFIDANKITWLKKRRSATWGGFNVVKTTLDGMRLIMNQDYPISHLTLLSGMDYPLKPINSYHDFLTANPNKDYIQWSAMTPDSEHSDVLDRVFYYHLIFPNFRLAYPPLSYINYKARYKKGFWWNMLKSIVAFLPKKKYLPRKFLKDNVPYKGSQWWTLSISTVKKMIAFLDHNKQLINYFKFTLLSDEIFFATLMMNEPINDRDNMVNDNLRYIEWDIDTTGHPNTLGVNDYNKLAATNAFFARKFDVNVDSEILALIDKNLL